MSKLSQLPEMQELATVNFDADSQPDISGLETEGKTGVELEEKGPGIKSDPSLNAPVEEKETETVEGETSSAEEEVTQEETGDFKEYIQQFPELADIEDFDGLINAAKAGRSEQKEIPKEVAAQLERVDAFLRGKGFAGGIKEALGEGGGQLPAYSAPQPSGQMPAKLYVGLKDKAEELFRNGTLPDVPEYRTLVNTFNEVVETNNEHNRMVLSQIVNVLADLQNETGKTTAFRSDAEYNRFKSDFRGDVLPKATLDKIRDEVRGFSGKEMTYTQAMGYLTMTDPTRMEKFLKDFKVNETQKDAKTKKFTGKFTTLPTGGKPVATTQTGWQKYMTPEGMFKPAYDTLPQTDRDKVYIQWQKAQGL